MSLCLSFRVELGGLVPKGLSLSMQDIRSLPKVTVVASLQEPRERCRHTTTTAGIPLKSVATPEGGRHVEFVSVDTCKVGSGERARICTRNTHTTHKRTRELERDHGYPLRVVVPGVIGARSVKWLKEIIVQPQEGQGFFVQRDYKMFPPWIDWSNIDWSARRPIMDFSVQMTVRGYALSGGGRGIERVDVSLDGGATWQEARRLAQRDEGDTLRAGDAYVADDDVQREKWAWVLWELPAVLQTPCDIVVRAVDSSSNTQPEDVMSIWNLRGVLNSSWHRVHVAAPQSLPDDPLSGSWLPPLSKM
eukprot:jgi/Mesen1/5110/ME000254S04137